MEVDRGQNAPRLASENRFTVTAACQPLTYAHSLTDRDKLWCKEKIRCKLRSLFLHFYF
jgi:hypothetical protein